MKGFKAIYKHGHFIDVETNKRLIPVQGEEYTITAKESAFKTEDKDIKLMLPDSLNSLAKENWINKKYGDGNYIQILSANEQLFFRVGISKRDARDESHEYIFLCTLKEDLYLYPE